ncbi:MAG: carboxy terminal-processing peptidase [Akkermansia sp.]
MNNYFSRFISRSTKLALLAAAGIASISTSQAAPDYNLIGKNVAMVLQNGHFSRTMFSSELYQKFLDQYLKTLDPTKIYLTQADVDKLKAKYGDSFGDYLITGETQILAEEIHQLYNERALARINKAMEIVKAYKGQLPAFDSERTIARTRRDLPWAADEAALDQLWKDLIEDMMLTEVISRENLIKLAKEQGKEAPKPKEMSVDEQVLARLTRMRNTVQEQDLQDIVSELLSSVAHVYDPHSDYMGAREEQRFMDMLRASLVGIGAQLKSDDDGSTKITGIVKGGPAQKSGLLQLGDKVIAVDRNSTGEWNDILYMSIEKVVDQIRGDKGKTVSLRIIKEDTGVEKVVAIKRDEVPIADELASGKIITTKVADIEGNPRDYRLGIITLPSFYIDLDKTDSNCAKDVKAIVRRMNDEQVDGIILDLRNNGGGSLEGVRKIVGLFTGSGPTVQVKNARGAIAKLTVSGSPIFEGELLVLINKLSASASEIFAGAMADYGRAIIAGDTSTFGKGTVQVPKHMASFLPIFADTDGCGMLKFTNQKFYRVGGSSTQLKGVLSDIVLPSATAAFEIGESELDNPLPYDEIPKASGYTQNTSLQAILPRLTERSQQRVAADKDMQYLLENIAEVKKRIAENSVSLNKDKRIAENEERLARKREMDAERTTRYEQMSKDDKANMCIYQLDLADVDKKELSIAVTDEEDKYMQFEESEEDKLTKSPDYPSGLDPEMREALMILRDMIDLH